MRVTPALAVAALCLLALGALGAAHDSQTQHSHGGAGPEGALVGRYQLTRFARGEGLQVLDRAEGRLFCLDFARGEAVAIDLAGGAVVTRPLVVEELRPHKDAPLPAWPARSQAQGQRYVHLATPGEPRISAGGAAAVFDQDEGRVLLLTAPDAVEILDPIEGKRVLRTLRARDETGLLARRAAQDADQAARAALRAIHAAERAHLAREGRYGSLDELRAAGLVDAALLARAAAHRLEAAPAKDSPAQRFLACANPTRAGEGAAYALTERGLLYRSARAIPLDPRGELPEHAEACEEAPQEPLVPERPPR